MIILVLLAIYGLTFAARSATLLERPRMWLVGRSKFLRELLSCPYCTGFHAGYIVYLVGTPHEDWSVWPMALYGFAGAAVSYLLELLALKLEKP